MLAKKKRKIKIKTRAKKDTFPTIKSNSKPKNNINELIIYIIILDYHPY